MSQNTPECPLTLKQLRAIDLYARHYTSTQIASIINVDRRTIYRWRQIPEFQLFLNEIAEEARQTLNQEMLHRLEHMAARCIEALWMELGSSDNRLKTATYVMEKLGFERVLAKAVSTSMDNAPVQTITASEPPPP